MRRPNIKLHNNRSRRYRVMVQHLSVPEMQHVLDILGNIRMVMSIVECFLFVMIQRSHMDSTVAHVDVKIHECQYHLSSFMLKKTVKITLPTDGWVLTFFGEARTSVFTACYSSSHGFKVVASPATICSKNTSPSIQYHCKCYGDSAICKHL